MIVLIYKLKNLQLGMFKGPNGEMISIYFSKEGYKDSSGKFFKIK